MVTRPCRARRLRRLGQIALVVVALCVSVLLAPTPAQAGTSFHNTRIYAVSRGGTVWTLKLDLKGHVVSRAKVNAASGLQSPHLADVFAGRVLLYGQTSNDDPTAPTVWILNLGGHLRPVTTGFPETFSPAGSAVLLTRDVDSADAQSVRQVFLRDLATGKETLLFEASANCGGPNSFQMSSDHRFIWMNDFCVDGSWPQVFSFADRKIHRYTNPRGILGCGPTQLLPGGMTVLSVCDDVYAKPQVHRFVVFRISNGKVLRQVAQNPKLMVYGLGGLLDKTHALASVRTSTGHDVLGRLDLKTLGIRLIPHTWGLSDAVTESN